jgi:steroid delta-isomerase-like uncharacterized protein
MNHLAAAHQYFDAWNAHDADAIAATFAPAGTYSDPQVSGLDGAATGAYAAGLWESFPDLRFEILSAEATPDARVAAQWVMRGTNKGSFVGLPPTGREVSVPGADFISFAEDGIATVQGYFDGGALPRQLGLNVLVQPTAVGPWSFGTASRVGIDDEALPGAITVTVLEARSDEEREEVRTRGRQIASELLEAPGFISFVGVTVGNRLHTLTSWESAEAVPEVLKSPTHRESVRLMFGPELGSRAAFGVFVAAEVSAIVRCNACGKMTRAAETCGCGAALPPAPALV